MDTFGRRAYLGLGLISAAVLGLEVIFTRVFSIMIWYHFAYLIIGVALLGGGAAATFLALQGWDAVTLRRRLGPIAVGFSASILLGLFVVTHLRFDPLGGPGGKLHTLGGLAVYFAVMFTSFFLSGLAVSGIFALAGRESHRLYSADLLGASASTLAVLWVVRALTGPGALALVAVMAGAAGVLLCERRGRWRGLAWLNLAVEGACLAMVLIFQPVELPVPGSKELGWIQQRHGLGAPELTRWDPVARIDVMPPVEFNERSAWIVFGGISSTFHPAPHRLRFVTLDGTSATALHEFHGDFSPFAFLEHTLASAPYQVSAPHPRVLNIGTGGGIDVILARLHEVQQVTAIELNASLVGLLKGEYADFTGHLADDPRTRIIQAEGRSFLTRDTGRYDIIQGIGVDNFAALSGGAYVLAESYLYTVESLEAVLRRLTPDGVFSWTRNTNEPPRETLRLAGIAAEALRRQGGTDIAAHLAIVANEPRDTATLLVRARPFTADEAARLRRWAEGNRFTLLHDPLRRLDTPYADYLHAPDPRAYEAAYPFQIHPVTDDSPFFYSYFKWSNLRASPGESGDVNTLLPVGNFILLALLGLATAAAAAFIAAPLLLRRRQGLQGTRAAPMLSYFSALGLGYIFVEVVLIQRFTLFVGYPTTAVTTTLFAMLLWSGVGSLLGRRLCTGPRALRAVLAALAGLLLIYLWALPGIFAALLHLPDFARVLVSVALIAPLGVLMGMPFPTGLRCAAASAPELVSWAWGINGAFSVIGSVLVVMVSMQARFTGAMVHAALLYGIAAAVAPALWQEGATRGVGPNQARPSLASRACAAGGPQEPAG